MRVCGFCVRTKVRTFWTKVRTFEDKSANPLLYLCKFCPACFILCLFYQWLPIALNNAFRVSLSLCNIEKCYKPFIYRALLILGKDKSANPSNSGQNYSPLHIVRGSSHPIEGPYFTGLAVFRVDNFTPLL